MKSKQVLVIFVFGLFCLSIFSQNDSSKPNVLFIVCDDLNDYQGVFGGHPQAKTPNIDKLAAMGVQFVNAQTNVPVCSPSRNSFITGVYPHVSKDYGWTDLKKQPVLKNNKTIMRLFKDIPHSSQSLSTLPWVIFPVPKVVYPFSLKSRIIVLLFFKTGCFFRSVHP